MSEDLGAILDNLLMDYIRVAGIFFVGGIALFNFTEFGKTFAIISLLISLLLTITAIIDYYFERNRISQLGFFPRKVIDILACIMIGIAFLIGWVIYQVWFTEPKTISYLVKEFEKEIETTNAQLIENIKEFDDKILVLNQELVDALKGKVNLPSEPLTKNVLPALELGQQGKKYGTALKSLGKQQDMVTAASLAVVS